MNNQATLAVLPLMIPIRIVVKALALMKALDCPMIFVERAVFQPHQYSNIQ